MLNFWHGDVVTFKIVYFDYFSTRSNTVTLSTCGVLPILIIHCLKRRDSAVCCRFLGMNFYSNLTKISVCLSYPISNNLTILAFHQLMGTQWTLLYYSLRGTCRVRKNNGLNPGYHHEYLPGTHDDNDNCGYQRCLANHYFHVSEGNKRPYR